MACKKLDLNQADPDELMALAGIGPEVANVIVQDRAAHGRFENPQDLDRVPGIDTATLARLACVAYTPASNEPQREIR